ncbi:MAG: GCAxxG family protein [Acidobacteria bacterium]|nr:GCAxxG family protein [Acidobacteriota bacterium]
MTDHVLRARELFLDDTNAYGCAEVTLIVLQEALGLPDAGDSSPAMALNGGIAYSGGTCGAITGAALAAGRLAGRCLADHSEAKREARRLVQELMTGFRAEFGSVDCRHLTGYDLDAPGQHEAFIADGTWRVNCMRQIEYTVGRLTHLAREAGWASPPAGDSPTVPPVPAR